MNADAVVLLYSLGLTALLSAVVVFYLGPPLRGEYRVTTPFGMHPAGADGADGFHPGVDYAADSSAGGDGASCATYAARTSGRGTGSPSRT